MGRRSCARQAAQRSGNFASRILQVTSCSEARRLSIASWPRVAISRWPCPKTTDASPASSIRLLRSLSLLSALLRPVRHARVPCRDACTRPHVTIYTRRMLPGALTGHVPLTSQKSSLQLSVGGSFHFCQPSLHFGLAACLCHSDSVMKQSSSFTPRMAAHVHHVASQRKQPSLNWNA